MAKTEFEQDLSSALANAVYLLKTEDDIITAILALNNGVDVNRHIVDLQEHLYDLAGILGISGEGDPNSKVYATNYNILDGDTRKEVVEKLDAAMKVIQDNIVTLTAVVDLNKLISTSDLALAASGEITENIISNRQLAEVGGDGALNTLSNTPFGSSGSWKNGLEIEVICIGAFGIKIPDSDIQYGTLSNGSTTLNQGDTATYIYNITLERFLLKARSV